MGFLGNRRRGRPQRNRDDEDRNRLGLDLRLVTIIIILFAAIPFIFFEDQNGIPFRLVGTYFWLFGLVVGFTACVFYFSQFVLPIHWFFSWYEAFRLTMRYNFPFLIKIVREMRIRPNILGATPEAAKELPRSFLKHKAGIIMSHQAPVIYRGSTFVRGVGPGFLRLKQGERVVQVIDLRRHFRRMSVRARTRDGISVTTGVSTIFQVKQEEDPADPDLIFPFEQDAIFKINLLGNFKLEDNSSIPWSDRVCRQAASALIREVSNYSLDELFQPDESGIVPLEQIKAKIRKQVERFFKKHGIEIFLVGASPFEVDDEIKKERVNIWRAEWQRQIEVQQGTANAERDRILKLARARAQIEMIEKLTEGLEVVHQTGEDMTDVLALRLIESIEQSETNAAVSALIPSQIANDLKTIRRQVLGEKD